MSANSLAILNCGLVSPVGLDAPSSCAAYRAKVTNPTKTRFMDTKGEWIMAHQVPMDKSWVGIAKQARMAAMAIEEALAHIPRAQWCEIPIILCVAEADRPGRLQGTDDQLFLQILAGLDIKAAPHSAIIAHGRVAVAVAMARARELVNRQSAAQVLIVAVDSLLTWSTLMHMERDNRLLTARNADGFMPGEGAAALLVGAASASSAQPQLLCTGIGFAQEAAHIYSEEPMRADGLSQAIKLALSEAGRQMHDFDFQMSDISGEQFYFKEASLALSRTLRQRKAEFELWHPAECIGETGALAGAAMIVMTQTACAKGYAPGNMVMAHMSNDRGQRAALALQFGGHA